jgi:hypothetical protein
MGMRSVFILTFLLVFFTIFILLSISIPVSAWTKPELIGEGSYPTIAQDEKGVYWLVFNRADGLYITNSTDLKNWINPIKLPFSLSGDFDAYLRIYDGTFYITFTRHKIIDPHSLFGFDYDVYLAVGDGENWKLLPVAATNESVEWYPYIYRDPTGKFWLVYSKDYKDGNGSMIVVRYSSDGESWSREYPAIPPSATFGSLFYFKDRYWMVYAKYTGNYSVPEIMNLHDLYMAYSFDGLNWVKAAKLTETLPPYNFTLYVDSETDGESIWVAYTSTIEGNEEVYIMGSPDSVSWSKPIRLSRNIEYIRSLENPYNFKSDQKDLLIDRDGKAIVVYQSAIYPNTTLWITYGKTELGNMVKTVNYNISLPYTSERLERRSKGSEIKSEIKSIPAGIGTTLLALAMVFYMVRRK